MNNIINTIILTISLLYSKKGSLIGSGNTHHDSDSIDSIELYCIYLCYLHYSFILLIYRRSITSVEKDKREVVVAVVK